MLSLYVKIGSDVFIGDDVRIVVKGVNLEKNTVELHFHAPKEIKILRGHLYRQKRSDSQAPSKPDQASSQGN